MALKNAGLFEKLIGSMVPGTLDDMLYRQIEPPVAVYTVDVASDHRAVVAIFHLCTSFAPASQPSSKAGRTADLLIPHETGFVGTPFFDSCTFFLSSTYSSY